MNENSAKKTIILYYGHKLTKATEEFIERMNSMRSYLESALPDCRILKFLGVKDGTSADVFQQDIKVNVASCVLFIAIIDEESTGLGFEIASALYRYGKPVLILYTKGKTVTRLVLGAVIHESEQMLERVMETEEDAANAVREAIKLYGLDTFHPKTFPCLEDMRPKSPFMREVDNYEGYEHMSAHGIQKGHAKSHI